MENDELMQEINKRTIRILNKVKSSLQEYDGLTKREAEMLMVGIMYGVYNRSEEDERIKELAGPLIENPKNLDELIKNATKKVDTIKMFDEWERDVDLDIAFKRRNKQFESER